VLRRSPSRPVRVGLHVGFALMAVGFGVIAVLGSWHDVRTAAGQLAPSRVGWAAAAALVGLFATMLSWRMVLADLGSPLPLRAAMRVFFLGQLGKYLPGSVWWLVGQVELAAEEGVPKRRMAAAGSLAVLLSLIAGLLFAAVSLPLLADQAASRYWRVLAAVPLLLAGLHPRVINPVLNGMLRLARREGLEHPLSGSGLLGALGLAAAAWVAFGLQVAVLAAGLGASGPRATALSVGGFALAWSVGFLAVVVPAGIGVREAALVAALAPVLAAGPAVVVALLTRVLMSGGDLAWAGVVVVRRRSAQRGPSDRV
jgi:glycosyltransferase 2 family protein